MQYFVVMIDYGRRGREAVVDPEITRREMIARIASGEYRNISFIHEIDDCCACDITEEILAEAALPVVDESGLNDIGMNGAAMTDAATDLAHRFDHARDLRKHEPV